MTQFRSILVCIITFSLGACATARQSQLATMGGAAVVGTAVGALSAPNGESGALHGALWGGIAAAAAGVASLFIFDNDKDNDRLKRENDEFKKQIQTYKEKSEPKLIGSGGEPSGKPVPESLRHLVRPGSWKLYKLDNWIQDGDSRVIHQDKLLEVEPSQIAPEGN